MTTTVKLEYGAAQALSSQRMQQSPKLAKLVSAILGYTNIGNYARSLVFRKQVNQLPLSQMNKIMDLGCGYGEYTFMMARALPKTWVLAIDIDPDALKQVHQAQNKFRLPNLTISNTKIDTLEENNFDLIYSVDVFEHIKLEEMPFKQCYTRLKKGGHLLVKMPHITQSSVFPQKWFADHQEWLNHEHPGQVFTLSDLKARFEEAGFDVVFASRTDGILSRLAWETAYLAKKQGAVAQLLSLPFCKLLVKLDMLFTSNQNKQGNSITVIGKKPN